MNKEDKLILGTLAGVDLVLSPEHYEEYKGTLNKQLEEKDKEIERLNNIINELEEWCNNGIKNDIRIAYEQDLDYEDILDKLKELKEGR